MTIRRNQRGLHSESGSAWTTVVAIAAVALLIVLLIIYMTTIGGCGQPKYWHVAGSGDTKSTYNILFVGDGFASDDEMRTYRRAVQDLAAGFLADPVICGYAGAINIFRVDVQSTSSISGATCSDGTGAVCGLKALAAPPPTDAAAIPVFENPFGVDVVETNFELKLCYTDIAGAAGDCKILWLGPKGQAQALQLALDGPDINLVVVLANAWNVIGSGMQGALVSGATLVDLVTAGVPADATTGVITDQAVALLSHETGHALGLLDEYVSSVGRLPAYANDRNVYKPSDPCWLPVTGAPPSDLPWLSALPCPSDPFKLTCECDTTITGGTCLQPWSPSWKSSASHPCCAVWQTSGITVPSTTTCSGSPLYPCSNLYSSGISSLCADNPGVIEGAFYSETGYYRSKTDCLMEWLDGPFCEACQLVIAKSLAPYGTAVACTP